MPSAIAGGRAARPAIACPPARGAPASSHGRKRSSGRSGRRSAPGAGSAAASCGPLWAPCHRGPRKSSLTSCRTLRRRMCAHIFLKAWRASAIRSKRSCWSWTGAASSGRTGSLRPSPTLRTRVVSIASPPMVATLSILSQASGASCKMPLARDGVSVICHGCTRVRAMCSWRIKSGQSRRSVGSLFRLELYGDRYSAPFSALLKPF